MDLLQFWFFLRGFTGIWTTPNYCNSKFHHAGIIPPTHMVRWWSPRISWNWDPHHPKQADRSLLGCARSCSFLLSYIFLPLADPRQKDSTSPMIHGQDSPCGCVVRKSLMETQGCPWRLGRWSNVTDLGDLNISQSHNIPNYLVISHQPTSESPSMGQRQGSGRTSTWRPSLCCLGPRPRIVGTNLRPWSGRKKHLCIYIYM
jgi:hypothetical protein